MDDKRFRPRKRNFGQGGEEGDNFNRGGSEQQPFSASDQGFNRNNNDFDRRPPRYGGQPSNNFGNQAPGYGNQGGGYGNQGGYRQNDRGGYGGGGNYGGAPRQPRYPDGNRSYPDGNRSYPDGNRSYPDGNRSYPDGNRAYPPRQQGWGGGGGGGQQRPYQPRQQRPYPPQGGGNPMYDRPNFNNNDRFNPPPPTDRRGYNRGPGPGPGGGGGGYDRGGYGDRQGGGGGGYQNRGGGGGGYQQRQGGYEQRGGAPRPPREQYDNREFRGKKGKRYPRPHAMTLVKALVRQMYASRKLALRSVQHGEVEVNGITTRQHNLMVYPQRDIVTSRGLPLNPTGQYKYLVFHKPRQVSGGMEPGARAMSFLQIRKGWHFPVGSLEKSQSGLVIITNDPEHNNAETSSLRDVEKEYRIKVHRTPTKKELAAIQQAVLEDSGENIQVAVHQENTRNAWISLVVRETKLSAIFKALKTVSLEPLSTERFRVGDISIEDMPVSSWRRFELQELSGGEEGAPARPAAPKPAVSTSQEELELELGSTSEEAEEEAAPAPAPKAKTREPKAAKPAAKRAPKAAAAPAPAPEAPQAPAEGGEGDEGDDDDKKGLWQQLYQQWFKST